MPPRASEDHSNNLWVFGYGSLCWKPGFEFRDSVVGHIRGFSRKFWQGNTTHRGTPENPGRVATLVEDREAVTYGVAFQLIDEAAFDYLNNREITLGGYITHITMFQPKDPSKMPIPVLLYVATTSSQHWLGYAPEEEIADQVIQCRGNAGHNVEYVLKLANWIRNTLPEVSDDHLFQIERDIRKKVDLQGLCLASLMGDDHEDHEHVVQASHDASDQNATGSANKEASGFSSLVRPKCLRCTKV